MRPEVSRGRVAKSVLWPLARSRLAPQGSAPFWRGVVQWRSAAAVGLSVFASPLRG